MIGSITVDWEQFAKFAGVMAVGISILLTGTAAVVYMFRGSKRRE